MYGENTKTNPYPCIQGTTVPCDMMHVIVPFLNYMNMLIPIVLFVATNNCLQTKNTDVADVYCCIKFHVCQFFVTCTLHTHTSSIVH